MRALINLMEAPIGAVGTAPAVPAPAVPAPVRAGGAAPGFDPKMYFRQLRQSSVEVQRLRNATSPAAADQRKAALLDLVKLFRQGKTEAEKIAQPPARDAFVTEINKIVAASGVQLPTATPDPNAPKIPGRDPGVAGDAGDAGNTFQDRLPRFMRKWNEDDPKWRLLQSATIERDGKTYVAGIAEMRGGRYVFFHGENGGQYSKPIELSLDAARQAMSRAFRAGYSEIPTKVLASKMGLTQVANQQYSIDHSGKRVASPIRPRPAAAAPAQQWPAPASVSPGRGPTGPQQEWPLPPRLAQRLA